MTLPSTPGEQRRCSCPLRPLALHWQPDSLGRWLLGARCAFCLVRVGDWLRQTPENIALAPPRPDRLRVVAYRGNDPEGVLGALVGVLHDALGLLALRDPASAVAATNEVLGDLRGDDTNIDKNRKS